MKLRKLLVVGIAAFSLVSANITAFAGGCSNWIVDHAGSDYCVHSDGCGFLWLKDNHHQVMYYYRTCVNNSGDVTTEYMADAVDLGCCD